MAYFIRYIATKPRVYRERKDCLALFDDDEIIDRYRVNRAILMEIINGFSNSEWAQQTKRGHAVSNAMMVSIARKHASMPILYNMSTITFFYHAFF